MIVDLETPLGPSRMYAAAPTAGDPRAVLLLGHGAGGGVDAPDLVALTALGEQGIAVLRFEQPWRTAGRRIAPAPARLDEGWAPAVAYAEQTHPGLPLFVGGRSAGARVAVRWAAAHPVAGVVALSFPLHPPGKPEKSRAPELLGATAPVLVLQGERDPFGTPAEVAAVVDEAGADQIRVVVVPNCAHELKPPARAASTPEQIAAVLTSDVTDFVDRIVGGRGRAGE
ncbi:alpha/beta hydrolase family protein [Enemella evansiae]|uniref:alpha/beta hydrolase family protein n=1 Tax=Enemella evansiae TaxID=2016499 RepID=UPI001E559627|nr:alpha/beta family hydrolase [Enemella evansiae]